MHGVRGQGPRVQLQRAHLRELQGLLQEERAQKQGKEMIAIDLDLHQALFKTVHFSGVQMPIQQQVRGYRGDKEVLPAMQIEEML